MSFHTALSGLNIARTDLDVISNNIANANTMGFKQARAEFAETVNASPFSISQMDPGSGARVTGITQQFSQGSLRNTNSALDMAISGSGFFILSNGGARSYTRAGNFSVDSEGFVVNPSLEKLQVFAPNAAGGFDSGRITDLQITTSENAPVATENITMVSNLPADADPPLISPFDPANSRSYNHTASLTAYDSLGVPHVATLHYVKTANVNEWDTYLVMDGSTVGGAQTIQYSSSGNLTSPVGGLINSASWTPSNGAAPMTFTIDLLESTQYGNNFSVNMITQDGSATGRLSSLSVSETGEVFANYSNGRSTALGQVALANFANVNGLQKMGDNGWAETYSSGQPTIGQAATGALGLIQGNALENSNVVQTEQLVDMITAQRNFQANAQMITTQDQIMQTLLNIR